MSISKLSKFYETFKGCGRLYMSKIKILLITDKKKSDLQYNLEKWGYPLIDNLSIDDAHLKKVEKLNPQLILIENLSEKNIEKIDESNLLKQKSKIPILFISPKVNPASLEKMESLKDHYYIFNTPDDGVLKFSIETIVKNLENYEKYLVGLEELNRTFSRLSLDPDVNIENLTILCGKLLHAHSALYNSLEGDYLYSKSHWNLPRDPKMVNPAQGHICFDVINQDRDEIFLVNNLPETPYNETDPNVKAYNLKTYLGYPVKFAGRTMGTLCTVYQHDYIPDEDEKNLIKILASAIGEEEERKKMISDLKESEDLFRSLWDNNLDATLILDWDGKVLFANPAAGKLAGLDSSSIAIGLNIFNYIDEKTRKRVKKHIELVKQGKGGFLAEYELKDLSGKKRWVEGLGTKIQFKGEPANIVNIRDITARKMSEKKIKESESFYKSIFENTGTATILVGKDHVISLANSEFEKISGYSSKEIEGKMKWTEFVHEDCKEMMLEYHNLRRTEHGKAPTEYEFKFVDREKKVKDILLTVDLIKDTKKSVASLMDITKSKAASKALKESNKLYETLIQTSPEAITVTDLDGNLAYVSQRKLDLYGYESTDEIIGKKALDLIKPEDQKQVNEDIKELLEKGTIRNRIYHMKKKNGKYFHGEISASLFKDVNNVPKGIIITTRDVTYQKKIEKQLRKREELLTLVTDNMLNVVGQVDSKGIFQYISPSVKEILGYPVEEVLGSSVFEFLEKVHPDDYDEVKNTFMKATRSYMRGDVTHRYKHAEGHYLWVESLGNPLFNGENKFQGIVFSLIDITALKNAEIELRKSEEKYRTLFASSPDYIIVITPEGKIIALNDILLKTLSKHIENISEVKHISELGNLSQKHYKLMKKIKSQLINGKDIKPFEIAVEGLDNKKHWLEIRTIPMKEDEEISVITIIAREISDRKLYENTIKKSLEEKDLLLKEIHHRVKNNLQIISSLLNLQSTFIEDSDAFDVFQESQNRVRSMAMIHEQLYQSKDLSHINFSEYIHSLVSGLLSSYNVNPNQIKVKIQAKNIFMDINTAVPSGLIINELVTNSMKHAFPLGLSGEISIKLHKKNEKYVLEVSDTGIGIPEEIDVNKNNTLGFLLINSLIKQLDGTVKLNRTRGTSFILKFSKMKYKERI